MRAEGGCSHTLYYESTKAMCKEDEGSEDLVMLGTLLGEIIIQLIGMVVYRSLADWTEELHDSRIIAPLQNVGLSILAI